MANDWCVNGTTLDDANYPSPMPVIGLYIAGATLVCFLFMFYDICLGLRDKKQWLPCKLFPVNSLTLTLLSVVTKLPVDLTSSMPRGQDQLSKLTGTTIICTFMAFFMPSFGSMSISESFSNMAALTIVVVTVVVNVCIQIGTGVIFSFIVEHIIILILMLLLLAMLWAASFEINHEKDSSWDSIRVRELLVKERGDALLDRLRLCYVYSYVFHSQLVICRTHYFATVGIISASCLVILSEVVLRAFVFSSVNFCGGDSDYKWSMWLIVVSQILTVVLGFVGNFLRWITFVPRMNRQRDFVESKLQYLRYQSLKNCNPLHFLSSNLTYLILFVISSISKLVSIPSMIMVYVSAQAMAYCGVHSHKHRDAEAVKDFEDQFVTRHVNMKIWLLKIHVEYIETHGIGLYMEKWLVRKAVAYMVRWTERMKRNPHTHLVELISNTDPSQLPLSILIQGVQGTSGVLHEDILGKKFDIPYLQMPDDYTLSCLSIVMLVRWSAGKLSQELSESLVHSLDEAFEVIYFIDKKLSVSIFENKEKLKLAKELWKGRDFTSLSFANQHLPFKEVFVIKEFIHRLAPQTSSTDDVYTHGPQLFVHMLHWFLAKLPIVIFKDIVDGPWEELEERVLCSIEFLCKLESLESKIQWEFPSEMGITRLITAGDSASVQPERRQSSETLEDNIPWEFPG